MMTPAEIEKRAEDARAWMMSDFGRHECARLVGKYGPNDGYLICHAIRRTGEYGKYEDLCAIIEAVHRQRMAEAVCFRKRMEEAERGSGCA